jgi:toxin YoeB
MKNQKSSNKELAQQPSVAFTDTGWDDYQHRQMQDARQRLKIKELIDACIADPFKGMGSQNRSRAI